MEKDDATWLNVAYVCFFVLIGYVAYKALETVGIQTGWLERYEWYDLGATLLGLAIGVISTLMVRRKSERHEYFLASIGELRKVSWPSWKDTKRMTIVVVVVVGVFAVILSVFDIIWTRALRLLIA